MAQRDVNPTLSMFSQVEKFATGSGYIRVNHELGRREEAG